MFWIYNLSVTELYFQQNCYSFLKFSLIMINHLFLIKVLIIRPNKVVSENAIFHFTYNDINQQIIILLRYLKSSTTRYIVLDVANFKKNFLCLLYSDIYLSFWDQIKYHKCNLTCKQLPVLFLKSFCTVGMIIL